MTEPVPNPPGVIITYHIRVQDPMTGKLELFDYPLEPVEPVFKENLIQQWNVYFDSLIERKEIIEYKSTWRPTWIGGKTNPVVPFGPGQDKNGKYVYLFSDGKKFYKINPPNAKAKTKPDDHTDLNFKALISTSREAFLNELAANGYNDVKLAPDMTITIHIKKDEVPAVRNIAIKHRIPSQNPIENPKYTYDYQLRSHPLGEHLQKHWMIYRINSGVWEEWEKHPTTITEAQIKARVKMLNESPIENPASSHMQALAQAHFGTTFENLFPAQKDFVLESLMREARAGNTFAPNPEDDDDGKIECEICGHLDYERDCQWYNSHSLCNACRRLYSDAELDEKLGAEPAGNPPKENPVPNPPNIKVTQIGTIADVNKRDDLTLVIEGNEVDYIKAYLSNHEDIDDFDGFLAKAENGDYTEIYGFYGVQPNLTKDLYKIEW